MNKAGYTANTSCGRVGRGGNASFHVFRLVFTDGRTDRRTDGQTDKGSYRVACPQLKSIQNTSLSFDFPFLTSKHTLVSDCDLQHGQIHGYLNGVRVDRVFK